MARSSGKEKESGRLIGRNHRAYQQNETRKYLARHGSPDNKEVRKVQAYFDKAFKAFMEKWNQHLAAEGEPVSDDTTWCRQWDRIIAQLGCLEVLCDGAVCLAAACNATASGVIVCEVPWGRGGRVVDMLIVPRDFDFPPAIQLPGGEGTIRVLHKA